MANIRFEYSTESPNSLLKEKNVFAVFSYEDAPWSLATGERHINTGLPSLSETQQTEVWRCESHIESGESDGVSWCESDDLLICSTQVHTDSESLSDITCRAYSKLLSTISMRGFPFILRAWNYFSGINQGEDDAEKYKQFCVGRYNAFKRYYSESYPSACAIGHSGGPMIIYLLASKHRGENIENPLQLSAFNYPRQYGPKAPSFARATASSSHVYISGTASIRGHKTIHSGDFEPQLDLTISNINQLVSHTAKSIGSTVSLDLLKIYVRKTENLAAAQRMLNLHYPNVPTLFVRGDICRKELEVEVDGLCSIQAH